MTSPQRFLNRVILFLVLALIVAGALGRIVWGAFLHNPLLNALILTVLLIGIGYNIRRIFRLKPEAEWIDAFREGSPGFGQPEAPRLIAPIATVVGQRDRRGRAPLSAMTMRYLLDSLSARLDESRDIARYLTGLMIFLGLLGTFWGLLEAISSISGVIAGLTIGSGDYVTLFNEMKAGLTRPLAGMGTAFSASLFGLAGSLVLGFLDLQATQAQNAFYNDLEEWLATITRHTAVDTAMEVPGGAPIPVYVQAMLQQTAENLDRLQGAFSRSEDGRAQLHILLNNLNERLGVLGDRLQREQELLGRLVEGQQQLTEQTLRRLEGPTAAAEETMRTHVRNIDMHLERLASDLARGREDLVRDLRGEIKLVARTIAIAAGEPHAVRVAAGEPQAVRRE